MSRRLYPVLLIVAYVLLIGQTAVLVIALDRQAVRVQTALCNALRVSIESDVETTAYFQGQVGIDDETGRRIVLQLEQSFMDVCGE